MNYDDTYLVNKCIANERQYQEKLYKKYADDMFAVCMTYCTNEDDACDVMQEGFIKVFRKLETFNFDCPLRMWIRRIIVNTALDFYRKSKRLEKKKDELKQMPEQTNNGILEQLGADELIRLVNSLPLRASIILKLYAIEGYSHKEIANKLDISEGTSKSQLSRARNLLRQKMNAL